MRRQLLPALGMVLVFTVLTGLLYPLVVTGVAQAAFHHKAEGSLVERDGQVVGSSSIGQVVRRSGLLPPPPGSGRLRARVRTVVAPTRSVRTTARPTRCSSATCPA